MKCGEIIEILRKLAPEEWACEWDNPGLLAGRMEKEVKRIFIALDATDQVIEGAIQSGADMLLTHHPLIFKAIKKVNDENFITRRLIQLIQADISCYAMHTNFDTAPGCMADLGAERLGLKDCVPLEMVGETVYRGKVISYGIGKTGRLSSPMTVRRLAAQVKEAFGLPFVVVYGSHLLDQVVEQVSICPGAGGSEIERAIAGGSQVFVTGDISHHQGIDSVSGGMAIIDGGHYGLEHMFLSYMADYLKEALGGKVDLLQASPEWPSVIA